MIPTDKIQDTETCYLQLWLLLESTRLECMEHYKRYCIRNILKTWFGTAATDDFIWEVCNNCQQQGLNELPCPMTDPRPHRELIRAIVSTILGKRCCRINLPALDKAYSIAYPGSTPLNINKKRRPP